MTARRVPEPTGCGEDDDLEEQYADRGAAHLYRRFPPSIAAQNYLALPTTRIRDHLTPTISYQAAEAYLAYVQQQPWFKKEWKGLKGVTVIGGGGRSRCQKEGPVIKIAASHRRWTRECEWMCLHQLAHMMTRGDVNAHAWAFQVNFVRLVHNID